MDSEKVIKRDNEYVLHTYNRSPIVLEKGMRSSKLRGAAGGHGFQDPLHGLWPRGHAAPGEDREEHQKGHQTGPGIARRHSTFRNCFVRRTA